MPSRRRCSSSSSLSRRRPTSSSGPSSRPSARRRRAGAGRSAVLLRDPAAERDRVTLAPISSSRPGSFLVSGLRRKELQGDYERGFLTHGLFRYSRHPNFFSEQAIWWCFYLCASPQVFVSANRSALGSTLPLSAVRAVDNVGVFRACPACLQVWRRRRRSAHQLVRETVHHRHLHAHKPCLPQRPPRLTCPSRIPPPAFGRTILGPFLLSLLFQGSTWYTEKLSCAKYPDYKYYQRTTSRLLPLPLGVPFAESGARSAAAGGADGMASPRRNARRSVRDH